MDRSRLFGDRRGELAPRWVVAQVGAIKGIDDSTLAGVTAAVTSLESESMTELPRRTVLGWSALGVQAKLGTLWVTTSNPTRPVELVLSDDRGLVEFSLEPGSAADSAGRALPPAFTVASGAVSRVLAAASLYALQDYGGWPEAPATGGTAPRLPALSVMRDAESEQG